MKHKKNSKTHSHKDNVLKSSHRKGNHIILFVIVIIMALIVLSYPNTEINLPATGQAGTQISYQALLIEGQAKSSFPTQNIIKFCSHKTCNYKLCNWGNIKLAGQGCLIFSYESIDQGCAYGIAKNGEKITPSDSNIEIIFSSGNSNARNLMNQEWKTQTGTYICMENKWLRLDI